MKLSEFLEQLGSLDANLSREEQDYEVRIECELASVYVPRSIRFEHNDKAVVIEA